ncbi:flagellar export protein FliJ [Gracilibacillus caseinilyticus]|uniref:Flagellar FliJ protein n=1 Tax=Gracilibacillus caseinilyticus TaxID=2932256 RepID=A0ABY4F0C3_9BACI|nr:flagellar export protein FliJ [Gracilibacillus caseinilyticus]UOQ47876.1 flagellar export protein FliJ [Gracilibacillus caseinilyticus]
MKQLVGYEKIKMLRENEKQEAQMKLQEVVATFEKQAELLYELLQKKERIEAQYVASLSDRTQIDQLQSYQQYLDFLAPTILSVQRKVDQARKQMNQQQEQVTVQYVEVKKIDHLLQHKQLEFLQLEQHKEAMMMDEISIRQYTDSRGR